MSACARLVPPEQGQLELQSHSKHHGVFQGKGLWHKLWLQRSSSAMSEGITMALSTTQIGQGHVIQCKLKVILKLCEGRSHNLHSLSTVCFLFFPFLILRDIFGKTPAQTCCTQLVAVGRTTYTCVQVSSMFISF